MDLLERQPEKPTIEFGEWAPPPRKDYRKALQYVADFETTTQPEDCRVWGWGLVGIKDDWQNIELSDVQIGTSIDSFLEQISLSSSVVYFHNLRFDGKFVLDWLFKNDYTHTKSARGGRIAPGCFTTLINDMGAFYSITVVWANGKRTEFRDSAKKLPMTVKRIAESFGFEQTKGDIDYHKYRPVGYEPDEVERDYIARDVVIVAKAIGQQIKNGMEKLTIGSDAIHEFRSLITDKKFDRLFPVLSLSIDAEIRQAYRGGFTYAAERYRGITCGAGMVFDVNSLYPSVMYNQPIPVGEPEYVHGKVEPTATHPLTIFAVTITAKIKANHIPCIQVKGSVLFLGAEYLTNIDEPTTLYVTDVDWKLINDQYYVKVISYDNGWRFRAATGVFDSYIDKYMRIKANSTGGIREIAKLFLNSLYGKFAVRPDVTGKIPYLDESGTVKFKRGPYEERNPVYTAAGVFITSYARNVTVRAAQANYDAFAYADTDSLHLLTNAEPKSIEVHGSNLGAWKHEYNFSNARYLRAKAYFEREESGRYHNAVAGVPVQITGSLTFDHLQHGTDIYLEKEKVHSVSGNTHKNVFIHGKLVPRSVSGGVVLMDTPYELVL